jgi:hypothetical protein
MIPFRTRVPRRSDCLYSYTDGQPAYFCASLVISASAINVIDLVQARYLLARSNGHGGRRLRSFLRREPSVCAGHEQFACIAKSAYSSLATRFGQLYIILLYYMVRSLVDEELPAKAPLADRRARYDAVKARQQAQLDALAAEAEAMKRPRVEDDFYRAAREQAAVCCPANAFVFPLCDTTY